MYVRRINLSSISCKSYKAIQKIFRRKAYDPDNGLLLSQNMDRLFDKGYILLITTGLLFYQIN